MKRIGFYILLISITLPIETLANAVAPALFLTMPLMIIGLIPIIGIESYIINKKLDISFENSVNSSIAANIVSTIIGIPFTWIILALVQVLTIGTSETPVETFFQKFLEITLRSPLMTPPYGDEWMIFAALLFLLIPFFFVSWKIEYFIIRIMNVELEKNEASSACFRANVVTYSLIALFDILLLICTDCAYAYGGIATDMFRWLFVKSGPL